jgi:hypothetical protein
MSSQILGTRQDTFLVNLTIEDPHNLDNLIDFGTWDTRTGGEVDSEERLYYPGGMLPAYSLGGRVTPGNVTISRNYRVGRDHDRIHKLVDAVGKSRCYVGMTPMDRYKKQHGPPITWVGTLKTVTFPEHNSESTGDPGMIELVISVDKPPVTA